MRDQLGIGIDGVANAGGAKHFDFDRISADPQICGLRRSADHCQRKHQEVDGANSKSPYPGQGWMPPNHGQETAKSKAHSVDDSETASSWKTNSTVSLGSSANFLIRIGPAQPNGDPVAPLAVALCSFGLINAAAVTGGSWFDKPLRSEERRVGKEV